MADDGSMKNDKRQESLAAINTSSEVRLILISFKAGSTGEYASYTYVEALLILRTEPDLLQQCHFDGSVVEPCVSRCIGGR
jgi:SNF2 family DNA or RNA helicase